MYLLALKIAFVFLRKSIVLYVFCQFHQLLFQFRIIQNSKVYMYMLLFVCFIIVCVLILFSYRHIKNYHYNVYVILLTH